MLLLTRAPPLRSVRCDISNAKPYKHTDDCITKSDGDSAENLIDGGDGEQSPPSRLGIVSEL